jgi:hypothetical protein
MADSNLITLQWLQWANNVIARDGFYAEYAAKDWAELNQMAEEAGTTAGLSTEARKYSMKKTPEDHPETEHRTGICAEQCRQTVRSSGNCGRFVGY